MLLTRRPALPLATHVETIWYYDGCPTTHHAERVLPNGRLQLVVNLAAGVAAVAGIRSHSVTIETAVIPSMMGVVFRAGGAHGFFGVPANAFSNHVVPLDAVWGSRGMALRDLLSEAPTVSDKFQRLESVLSQAMRTAGHERLALHPSVQHALDLVRCSARVRTVTEMSRSSGLSRRRLGQLFDEQVGMTPKLYCRLIRFREVVRYIAAGAPVDWADLAAAGGYSDQAHLSHDFRDFSGMSPSSYLAAPRPFINHVRITSHSYKTRHAGGF